MADIRRPDLGVVAIVRLPYAPPPPLREALVRGGITRMEITLSTPGCLDAVESWRSENDAVVVGVGTVRTPDDALRAANAGAQFLVTPGTDADVLRCAAAAGLPVASGAATPTEILNARTWGASWVKVFPADLLGGPEYVRSIKAPLPDIPLMPTGGVDERAARAYAQLGCIGIGVGSVLINAVDVAAGAWERLEAQASALGSAWRDGLELRGRSQ